jgi:hypothetical protein
VCGCIVSAGASLKGTVELRFGEVTWAVKLFVSHDLGAFSLHVHDTAPLEALMVQSRLRDHSIILAKSR